jgi:CRISPR/Cas system-associated endonuclease Cas3-HD
VATCAAGIRTIDGRPLYNALSRDESPESIFQAKLQKLRQYYPVVITEIYREILNLDVEFVELAVKLGKLKG